MITTLAVAGYRSLRDVVLALGPLTVVTGGNGSGKSSLYRALRLLSEVAQGRLIASLAAEGGLSSTLWAGPERIGRDMRNGVHPIQGTRRSGPVSLRLGFAGEDYGYAIDLGLPVPGTPFPHDPEIKVESVWGAFGEVIDDAFPGSEVAFAGDQGNATIAVRQTGLLRPLQPSELSDGTLGYLLLAAALLSPRPPALMILNEPETSLHPSLLAPLARLLIRAAETCQVVVVSHSAPLVEALRARDGTTGIVLEKAFGQTEIADADPPQWHWPTR